MNNKAPPTYVSKITPPADAARAEKSTKTDERNFPKNPFKMPSPFNKGKPTPSDNSQSQGNQGTNQQPNTQDPPPYKETNGNAKQPEQPKQPSRPAEIVRMTYGGRVVTHQPAIDGATKSASDPSGQATVPVGNGFFGFDPAPGSGKTACVVVRRPDGSVETRTGFEYAILHLGSAGTKQDGPGACNITGTSAECAETKHDGVLAVLKVLWGNKEIMNAEVIRKAYHSLMSHDGKIPIYAENNEMYEDPLPGQGKYLNITVRRRDGRVETLSAFEHNPLYLGKASDA